MHVAVIAHLYQPLPMKVILGVPPLLEPNAPVAKLKFAKLMPPNELGKLIWRIVLSADFAYTDHVNTFPVVKVTKLP